MGWLDRAVFGAMIVHIFICPYTKVEESFNMQAMHDIIYHGTDLEKYDHHEFPGVVPRTFLGPLFVSTIAAPFIFLVKHLNYSKFFSQLIVRWILGMLVCLSFGQFRQAVSRKHNPQTSRWLTLITLTQFHFLFYASRPLPNVFALSLALLSLASWLRGHHARFIWTAGCGVLIFRSELALLLGPILLLELFTGRMKLTKFILHAFIAGATCLTLTVLVDSYFWRRWLWPEGEVLWFNTVLNKSSEWGTSPYLWYIYSVLPRALGVSLLLVPVGWIIDKRSRQVSFPAMTFILLYSFLPHKELRFIIYAFPILNVVAASACNKIWQGRSRTIWRRILRLAVIGHLIANCMLTGGLLYVSHHNYPGGKIMGTLHTMEPVNSDVNVHIDVFTAQTGVTRFTQLHNHWHYDKTEDLVSGGEQMMQFTHILIESNTKDLEFYAKSHHVLAYADAISNIRLKLNEFPPFAVVIEPKIHLLKKNK